MPADIDTFFHAATGNTPYDYQRRLAGGDCASRLIDIPTGLGKTAAVVLAWLWNRVAQQNPDWPRRLVYCLPMRALVEQTRDEVAKWIGNLLLKSADLHLSSEAVANLEWLSTHSPIVLMGGEELKAAQRDWDIHPEKTAILIGTQDMLLSRALNRGYGMSRARWPMHFAHLHLDALWIFDETQLMGVAIETSCQLDAFRHCTLASSTQRLRLAAACTWWMSATLDSTRFATVDQPPTRNWPRLQLEALDLAAKPVRLRLGLDSGVRKPLSHAPSPLVVSSVSEKDTASYARRLAEFLRDNHAAGTLTLAVLNRVDRARAVFSDLLALGIPREKLALVHSRFRPGDRTRHQQILTTRDTDRIVVATQAVEAGMDVSAHLLVTELAPWSSLVQRFGRCNRYGESREARVLWIDVTCTDDRDTAPYTTAELAAARSALGTLTDVTSESLKAIHLSPAEVVRPVLRRKDFLDLFDTTPDLAGHDLDVSRYIRDGDDSDVQVFWRDLGGAEPADDPPESEPTRAELCRVSVIRFRDFLARLTKNKLHAFAWSPVDERWQPLRSARPRAGATYLLDVRAGGYSAKLGWTGEPADASDSATWTPLPPAAECGHDNPEAHGSDPQTFQQRRWITLADHTAHVIAETAALSAALPFSSELTATLVTAARWHDLGKAHPTFQSALKEQLPTHATPPPDPAGFYAKSAHRSSGYRPPETRRHFRHELASALAWLFSTAPSETERDLVAYLIAAHHGKVRLSLRSLPGEELPADVPPETRLARGILDGDALPAAAFALIDVTPRAEPLTLDLRCMELGSDPDTGEPSWLARTLALRDRLGPFALAYLETVLRAGDMRASAQEAT